MIKASSDVLQRLPIRRTPVTVMQGKSLFILLAATISASELSGETDFNVVGREMTKILGNRHYARHKLEHLEDKMLEQYLADLDPQRSLFTAGDVATFRKEYGGRIGELLLNSRSMEPAGRIYDRFEERVIQREEYVRELLEEGEFSFDTSAGILRSRKEAPWPANEKAARLLWQAQLLNEVLSEQLRRESRAKAAGQDPEKIEGEPGVEGKIMRSYARGRRNITAGNNPEDVAEYFLSAVAATYDPHTDYLSKRENERFQVRMRRGLVGIGVTLRAEDDGSVSISAVVIDGPADRAGNLKLKDRIVGVDSSNKGGDGNMEDILFMKTDRIVERIKGKEGTKVRLRIRPDKAAPGVFRDIVIVRGKVEYRGQLARAELIHSRNKEKGEPRVGYLRIPSFYYDFEDGVPSVSRDVEVLVRHLQKEGMDGLVLDLRGNGGGSLREVIRMAGFFIGKEPVVQVRDAAERVQVRQASLAKPLYGGPLVVLTDKASASASEILAGVLQDYNRALLVGDSSTYGKGTVQNQVAIGRYFPSFANASRAGYLKPTIQKYYRVSGSSVQLVGVKPDIILPSRYDAYEYGEASEPHALKHDVIAKSPDFSPLQDSMLFRDRLRERSAERVASSADFDYLREDIDRIKRERKSNRISLNGMERRTELEVRKERRTKRNEERTKRFARIEKNDRERFRFYELTLDDIEAGKMNELGNGVERTIYMRTLEEDPDGTGEAPPWPSGLNPVKRESISIALDLIEMTEALRVARKNPKG